ncbi:alpha/beta hydrolase [Streptacidiphilus fuscans]|uniref:Alpha/beta hydrolase n=1 Tax=Streptacidiphilus fuscans TaxID=2789292 RepID=A0A931FF69_9ACTN|nr:alpha/beta hydrolase [Streptacidiphilus fuscans]MBF9069486.1 alpha/beta hydrolase [Streptacidiphilus fuscans]
MTDHYLGTFPVSRRTVTRSAVLGLAAAFAGLGTGATPVAADGPTAADLVLDLPAPTGRHRVGQQPVYLVDPSRPDPWEADYPVRELMLTVFYPARDVAGSVPAPQLPKLAASLFGRVMQFSPLQLPAAGVDWGSTLSHSDLGAPALPGRWPVLVYSPGGGDPRGLGTCLAEELASHGAVVVTVDHPGDAAVVEFPGVTAFRSGRVRTTVLRGDPRDQPSLFRTMIDARIADLHFVLAQLGRASELPLPEGLADSLDLRRVGVYGHSAGGSAVTEVLFENREVRAGINLEGYLDYPPALPGGTPEAFPVAASGVDRPLFLLGSSGFDREQELDRSWAEVARNSGRWVRSARIADANHWVFTDCAAVIPQLQIAGLMTAAQRDALVGAVDPAVSVPEVRRAVRQFFARHLATW